MKTELYEKLQQLKLVVRQLDLSAHLALLERVRAQLPPEALMTVTANTFSASKTCWWWL
jgi:hypothetical protein